MMRKLFCLLISFTVLLPVFAQTESEDAVNKTVFLLPGFVNGKVVFKNGPAQQVPLNYNSLFSQMIFEQDGVKMAIDNIETVDTIFIDTMKFVPVDTIFYQVRLEQNKFPLFIRHTCTISKVGAATPFGGTTQTGAVQNLSSYRFGVATPYQLKVADEYTVDHLAEFWTRSDNLLEQIKTAKDILSLVPGREDQVKSFMKKNHTNVIKQYDMEQVLAFCSQLVQ
jgi:hypothetical protein